ncbi:hypothetical protein E2C01_045725 [Portunus trituberculatus]|uniref:Uncharacterized protein n=1 Tax=Portunus trituberculatus TaxID=210409 RepID=A0A5B7FVW5_PORTR|nr:hypothetical protein [Portunus trituberculatus]
MDGHPSSCNLPPLPHLSPLLFQVIHHQPSFTVCTNQNCKKKYIEIFINLRFCLDKNEFPDL